MNTMNGLDMQVQREKSLRVLNAVWLYDEDEECRRLVDESPEYGVYAHEVLRKQDATLHSYGEDYARAVAPGLADEPLGLVERTLAGMPEERRGVYQGEFDRLRMSGKDTRQDYYALYGKLVRDEVRGQYAEQQRVQRQQAERLAQVVSETLAGRGGLPTPEDYTLLTGAGIDYKDLQLAGYVAAAARQGASAEQQADILFEQNASPAARQMALQQIAADALEEERKTGERGFFENMVGSFSSTGEAIEDVAKSILPSERNMLHPDMMRGTDGEWLDNRQMSEKVTNRAAWRGRVREAVEQGRGQAREAIGFRVSAMPSNLASGLVRLAPWLVPTPAAKGTGVARFLGQMLVDSAAQGVAIGGLVTDSLSQGYGVQQAARDEGDDSIGDGQVMGKAAAATIAGSIPMGGGSWLVRNGVGRLLPQGMTWGARALSKAPVAYGVNAAATTATFGAALPAVEYGLNALYDLAPWQDDRLDTGVRDLEMLGEQMGSGAYWAEQGLLGAVLGAPAAGATRMRAVRYLGDLKGALSEGITRKQFESTIHMKPAEQMRELEKMRRRNLEEDAEGSIRQAVTAARELVDRERAVQMRTDEAIRAAMEEYGLSVEAAEQDGMVNLYYGGEVQPDGSFKRGEKFVMLSREDADVYLQASIGYKLENTARMLRRAAGSKRLLDAFRDELKGEVRVEWMREADSLAKFEGWKERALERIETRTVELVADGMAADDARREAQNEVHKDISDRGTLGELVQFATNMRERFEQEQASLGVELDPQAFGSRANVTRQRSADGSRLRRVLRIAQDARVAEVAEELGEQVMYDWRESQGMSVTEAYRYLRAFADWAAKSENAAVAKAAGKLLSLDKTHPKLAERLMADDFNEYDLSVDEYRAVERELTEAGSSLMLSELRQAAADGQMPGWARELFNAADLNLLELERDMNLAMAMQQARQEGVLPEAAQKLFGVGREAVEAALRVEPEAQEYHQAWYEVQKRQSELDAAYGAGKLTEPSITEEFEARARQGQEALEREREEEETRAAEAARERLEEYAAEPENAGKSHEQVVQEAAERAADAAEERLQGEPGAERDADFAGGLCLEIADEGGLVCKSGLLEVGKLKVLPNFKLGADADSGVVHPLKGDYRPDHDPIRVWRKAGGELMVISGRHRLDAAKRAGATRISAYVYDESEVRDLAWARRYDIESNIRDNQATPLEVALYVRGEFTGGKPLSNEEVERAGITREGKLGSIGFRIGRRAGESVMDALRNGAIDDRVALWIADFCPGNDAVQRRGLDVALRDGSKAEVLARMEAELAKQQMQEEMGLDGGMDLFGNTLDNDEFMDFVAQYVLRRRNELAQDVSYLNATAKKKNAEAMGKKYGVDVKDPVALKKKLAEINALRERWKNPYSDSELMDEIRNAWRAREGNDMPADAVASMAETPSERLFREYAAREWQTERTDYSGMVMDKPMVRVASVDVPEDKPSLVARLKELTGRKFYNKSADMQATISGESAKKIARAESETITNLTRLGYTEAEASYIHRAAATKIGELYEQSVLFFEEDVYHKADDRKAAWHFFEPVTVDLDGREESFLTNISVIDFTRGGERLFSLELTIENPISNAEGMAAPASGRQAQHPNGVSDVRLAAFESFVKKEKNQIERNAREKGLIPWRVDEARLNELRGEAGKIEKEIEALLAKFGGDEKKLQEYRRDRIRLHDLRERLAAKQAAIAAEYKPDSLPEVAQPIAPNGKPSRLSVDAWLTVRTKAFKTWFGDWENAPANASKVVDENGEPLVVYHGTWNEFTRFKRTLLGSGDVSPARSWVGHWFSENKMYSMGNIRYMECFLNLRNPYVVSDLETLDYTVTSEYGESESTSRKRKQGNDFYKSLIQDGYDGVVIDYDYELEGQSYIALKSNQIKSTTDNRGTFDAGSPRIDFSICGLKAKTANEYLEKGADYVDPADGQRKFVIPVSGARLRSDVTPGMLNVAAGGHKDVSLAALLHYPELFRAYPQLAEMRVRLYRPVEETSVGGYFSPEEGSEQAAYIAVNVAYRSEILNTLLHESQHAIQQLEGFAMGAGNFDQARALAYIGEAIRQRKAAGVNDDWSRDNLAFLERLQAGVERGDETSITLTYVMSHGEQEARFTGEGYGTEGGNPMDDGSAEPLMKSRPSSYTVAVRKNATDLGGVTFLNMGRFGYLLDERLMPAGEFHYDRRVYQMRENVMRRMRELRSQTDGSEEADGLRLAAEGLAVMDSVESLLPNTYRAALEPYKVYFNTYAKLRGSGDAGKAAATVPMSGWDARMYSSFYGMVYRLVSGKAEAAGEFWEHAFRDVPGAEEGLASMREVWEEVHEQVQEEYAERLADAPNAKERNKVRRLIETETFTRVELTFGEEMNKLFQALGSMRADKLMAKFLERVALQLDAFRKDTTLGRIRRVVNNLTPLPGKDGKPVKGRMAADAYNKVMDLMRLLELTKGQRLAFERTRYTGEEDCPDGKLVWADIEPEALITVDTYDADGEPVVVTCTKQEYETYACFDGMTAAQAESAGKALGEFITTGRQAWENMEELRRQRIAKMCTPLMEEHAETLNDERQRKQQEKRGVLPVTGWARKVHGIFGSWMNDAQFFDAMSGVKEVEGFARDFTDRMARAKVYIESKEKERRAMMMDAVFEASVAKSGKEAREFIDYINKSEKTKIVLRAQEPNFLELETATLRAQFMGLLRRKTHKKNFSPNTFAAMMKHLEAQGDEIIPAHILEEAMAKYGEIGDAKKSHLHGIEAMTSVLTQQEFSRFCNLTKAAKKRADKAREKWMEEKIEKDAAVRPEDEGGLELTRSEAAYRVLLCEQADYEETLRRQGYTEAVVAQLRAFAGEKMMRLAYRLRDELGARTLQIKDVYERVYGMPFPEVENYFRAYFDAGYEVHSEAIMGGAGEGRAAGKGTAKILYTRHHHNAKIDPTMNVLAAFECAMKEQDIMLGYGDLPTDISSVLNYRDGDLRMSDALAKVFSSHTVGEMKLIADNMTRAVPAAEETARWMTRCLSAMGSSTATAILNYRVGTLFKQGTALFNTLAGSDRVSWWEWHKAASRANLGLGKISLAEMATRPELDGRFKGWSASVNAEALLGDADVISAKGATDAAARAGMSLMEWIDMRANVRSCATLYDAVYRKTQRDNPGLTHEELDADAMNEVRRALAFKSQPLDWRSRALLGGKKSLFSIGNLFLGGESINTMGNVLRLMARGRKGDWGKAAYVWLEHGIALQMLTAVYNWMTDDEEQWKRRSWQQYVAGSVLGPLAGLPLVSAFVGAGTGVLNTFLPKEARVCMPTQSLLPMADMERVVSDLRKVFWGKKPSSWQDKTIAVENFIRTLATFGILASRNPTTAGGAKLKAMSYGVAAVTNILDFLLRTERAIEERVSD